MKLALLLTLALTGWGQGVSVVMEPVGPVAAKRAIGSDKYTLWVVYPSTADLTAISISRSAVTSLTPVTELLSGMAADLIQKDAGTNGWTLGRVTWDIIVPLVGTGLSYYGIKTDSSAYLAAGMGLQIGNGFRKAFTGQAPEVDQYTMKLLPDPVPCVKGNCGEWYVLTERVANPMRAEVGATIREIRGVQLSDKAIGFQKLIETASRDSLMDSDKPPRFTHPQVNNPFVRPVDPPMPDLKDAALLAAIERHEKETTSSIGAKQ